MGSKETYSCCVNAGGIYGCCESMRQSYFCHAIATLVEDDLDSSPALCVLEIDPVVLAGVRRKLGSESVKTQFSKIYFSQTYFLMAMNSHACLSGVSLADIYLTGYISHRIRISLGIYLTKRAPHWACISWAYIS